MQHDGHAQADHVARDEIHTKELYKYFRPSTFNTLHTSKSSSPDTVLTAHAQLVAWRLNTNRALISLIDHETQYFIAESTKTLRLKDGSSDESTDAVWAGCTSVPKAGRLCELTVEAVPPPNGGPSCFEVRDLANDARFKQLPFVCSGSQFRYYVGVPIKTRKGIAIGSLFAMDVKPRGPISDANINFMSVMAENVMTHMEMLQEREERKRAVDMNMRLADFVDPKHERCKRRSKRAGNLKGGSQQQGTRVPSYESYQSSSSPRESMSSCQSPQRLGAHGSGQESTVTDSDAATSVDDVSPVHTFERASELLCDALRLDDGGGVVFLNQSSGISVQVSTSDENPQRTKDYPNQSMAETKVNVLASTVADDNMNRPRPETETFTAMAASELAALIKRYPRGKLFTLDAQSILRVSSSEDEPGRVQDWHTPRKRKPLIEAEFRILQAHFPTTRQLVLVPIWDAISDCWSACLAYNCSDHRSITYTEFLYLVAFCNCISNEISRLATTSADKQKQDFIASMSHELRSPLHGILGSMEFLTETGCTGFQLSCIDTARSCAGTLLDAIQQILDFSKLGSSRRNANVAGQPRDGSIIGSASPHDPAPNMHGLVNLAVITEEVIECVVTGHTFRELNELDQLESASLGTRSWAVNSQGEPKGGDSTNDSVNFRSRERMNVEIILDISPRQSWAFVTQPGAFRRILMNIVGNSLKYTRSGHINVKLEAIEQLEPGNLTLICTSSTMIKLTVQDTGCGISPKFLHNSIFSPFCQESPFSPGNGIGLSKKVG